MRRVLASLTALFLLLVIGPSPAPAIDMQNGTFLVCSDTFYDNGGTGNYTNNQKLTMTLCSLDGSRIQVDFQSFQIEVGFDSLLVYDGPDRNSPLLGIFWGTNSPGVTTSTGDCLTFYFSSDGSITGPGWEANVTCLWSGINSIADVGNDQGRRVRVRWSPYWEDVPGTGTIASYSLYRRVEGGFKPTGDTPLATPPGLWDFVLNVPATGETEYSTVAETLCDSTSSGLCLSTFFVRAHSYTPQVFFDGEPVSGYSVDNLAPGVPQGFAATLGAGTVDLAWDPAPEPDFQYFRVYRSDDPGFVPGPTSLVHETATTSWQDSPADPGAVFYRITALDHAGNESDPASSGSIVAVGNGMGTPPGFTLLGAMPNPLRAGTRIAFDLPAHAEVSLDVFDATGRLVRSLGGETLAPGRHEITWDGADHSGREVAAGVYLYRLRTGTFEATRRMVVIR